MEVFSRKDDNNIYGLILCYLLAIAIGLLIWSFTEVKEFFETYGNYKRKNSQNIERTITEDSSGCVH